MCVGKQIDYNETFWKSISNTANSYWKTNLYSELIFSIVYIYIYSSELTDMFHLTVVSLILTNVNYEK